MISKDIIDETIDFCEYVDNGIQKESFNPENYSETVRPKLDAFRKKHSGTPNVLFHNLLKRICPDNLYKEQIASSGNFSIRGRSRVKLNDFFWATLYPSTCEYSDGIQLYILASNTGIKFGMGYGSKVIENTSDVVRKGQDSQIQSDLFEIISNNDIVNYYISQPGDDKIPKNEDKINITDINQLSDIWTASTQILGSFRKGEVPEDASEIIENSLQELFNVFHKLSLSNSGKKPIEFPSNDQTDSLNNKKKTINQILFGPPGTGKTFHTVNKALEIIGVDKEGNELNKKNIREKKRKDLKKIFDHYIENGRIVFTTFHQSMSYEDFVEGIKPQVPTSDKNPISYIVEDGIFKRICIEAEGRKESNFEVVYEKFIEDVISEGSFELNTLKQRKPFKVRINGSKNCVAIPKTEIATEMVVTKKMILDYLLHGRIHDWKPYVTSIANFIDKKYKLEIKTSENNDKPYVLIIDEINRGNISAIFGELITLIEEDKRIGEDEALRLTLPYSKNKVQKFGVPKNLYIIGTMNTADRSVEALDTALRRRFTFVEMPPLYEKLRAYYDAPNAKIDEIDLIDLLKKINERIEILLDRDHLIGHSYFLKLKSKTCLKKAFSENIIPLLQEYFYGDYGKITLVLGDQFCKGKIVDNIKEKFAINKNFDLDSYSEKIEYKIPNILDETFDIIGAIHTLMRTPNE